MKELEQIIALQTEFPDVVKLTTLNLVRKGDQCFPIYSIQIGPDRKDIPVFGLFAGVHGLERIGVELCLYYLRSICQQMRWDSELRSRLNHCRIVSIPMINPLGVYLGTRSNGNGVDLMRNAPIDAEGNPPFLAGGHRISPHLPWYRGKLNAPMETETQTLVDFVKKEMFPAPLAMALDLHSGFGFRDRFWYPHATTQRDFVRIEETLRLIYLLNQSYPNHIYQIEPTSNSYQIHGDIWDYLIKIHLEQEPKNVFVPWTLELGSWTWIRKNPFQFFQRFGIYNPIAPHRHKRVMRRHQILLDFVWRATGNGDAWVNFK